MTQPALFVFDDQPDDSDSLRATLQRRYGQEYLVVCERLAATGSDRLAQLAAEGRPVVIVCVPAATLDGAGGELLIEAHRLYPAAKRVLIVPRGGPSAPSLRVPTVLVQDPSLAEPVLRAVTLGLVDTYVPSPVGARDEGPSLCPGIWYMDRPHKGRRYDQDGIDQWLRLRTQVEGS